MRTLASFLIGGGVLVFILAVAGVRILPRSLDGPELALIAVGVGVILLWLDERDRQRRRWKGLQNKPKYYD